MKQDTVIHSKNYKRIEDQVKNNTPCDVINAIAIQLDRAQESSERIMKEGSVVRDMRGSVVEHPSIAIEQKATKMYVEMLAKWFDATKY